MAWFLLLLEGCVNEEVNLCTIIEWHTQQVWHINVCEEKPLNFYYH